MTPGKIIGYCIVSACVIAGIILYNYGQYKNNKIIANMAYGYGVVTNYNEGGGRGSSSIEYTHYTTKTQGHSTTSISYLSDESQFIGKSFPLVYDKTDPTNEQILIFPSDFERVALPFPDSLQWVMKYKGKD